MESPPAARRRSRTYPTRSQPSAWSEFEDGIMDILKVVIGDDDDSDCDSSVDHSRSQLNFERVGVSPEIIEFIQGLTKEIFLSFPCDWRRSKSPIILTQLGHEHAMIIQRHCSNINHLKRSLCPESMPLEGFWKVYFTIICNQLRKRYSNPLNLVSDWSDVAAIAAAEPSKAADSSLADARESSNNVIDLIEKHNYLMLGSDDCIFDEMVRPTSTPSPQLPNIEDNATHLNDIYDIAMASTEASVCLSLGDASTEGHRLIRAEESLICPISLEVMRDPVVACDGFSYERALITAWLETGNSTSPMTGGRLDHRIITPNHALRSLCDVYWSTRRTRNKSV